MLFSVPSRNSLRCLPRYYSNPQNFKITLAHMRTLNNQIKPGAKKARVHSKSVYQSELLESALLLDFALPRGLLAGARCRLVELERKVHQQSRPQLLELRAHRLQQRAQLLLCSSEKLEYSEHEE